MKNYNIYLYYNFSIKMEGYNAHFIPFDDINDDEGPFNLYLGHIELRNGDNIISKFELAFQLGTLSLNSISS